MELSYAEVHKRFPAAAEYLGNIYIIHRDYGEVSNARLAEWAGVSGSAVTQALGRLKRLELVRQNRYEHVDLTDSGRLLAMRVLRRHYLLEHLLVRILEYPWDKSDEEAKLLQGEISDDLTEHLYRKLGSPQTCPHGNPMPGAAVEAALLKAPRLHDMEAGTKIRILRITEEGEQIPTMLERCGRDGVQPGARFTVESKGADNVILRPNGVGPKNEGHPPINLPAELSRHICCEIL